METRTEALKIAVDKDSIACTLLAPAAVMPGVLFAHGWGGSQEQDLARAGAAAGLGCLCLTFDLRGHAAYEMHRETVTREENLRDLLAAYDFLVKRGGADPSAIAVVGSSYGGYLATILTSMRPVRWLALRAPAIYKDAGWELAKRTLNADPDLPAYRLSEVRAQDNRALRACADFKGDVLIVESEHDDRVPHAVIANYVAAFSQARSLTARMIKGADHGLTEEECRRAYTTVLMNWLTEMVVGARVPDGKVKTDEVKKATSS
jgi:pimeloyl-ACP methyl ester carboxylesterase